MGRSNEPVVNLLLVIELDSGKITEPENREHELEEE